LPKVSRSRRRKFSAAAIVAALALVSACSGKITTKAAYAGDLPDPSIIRVNDTYFAFGTQAPGGSPAIQRFSSTDLVHWIATPDPDALQALPAWADDSGTWAPEVVLIGTTYVMYYSAHEAGGRHCISVATSGSLAQPFVDRSTKPLACQNGGEMIDPTTFVGVFGDRYLLWKGPDLKGVATLFSKRLSADGLSLMGNAVQLMRAKPKGWPSYNIEGPSMVLVAGKYYLFYSGGNYWSPSYAIGYAVCKGPIGPCVDQTPKKPWFRTHGNAKGPGGQSFFLDKTGTLEMAYHAWGNVQGYSSGGIRSLWIDKVTFIAGKPAFGCFSGC
jgi:beta-xylosidase